MTYIPVEATNREIEAELINCRVSETLHCLMWDAKLYVNYLLVLVLLSGEFGEQLF